MAMVRNTKQRAAVIQVLRSTNTHPNAAWILEAVREQLPSISLGTVYRALEALVKEGHVMTIEHAGQATRYDYKHGEGHHHAVCECCGAVFDVPLPVPEQAIAQPKGLPRGFLVKQVHVEYVGICQNCLSKSEKDKIN